jgi:26S proteasome regulatory subunit N2
LFAGAPDEKEPDEKEERKKDDTSGYKLDNPARVVPAQEQFVAFEPASRWQPLKHRHASSGIILLKDNMPGVLRASA